MRLLEQLKKLDKGLLSNKVTFICDENNGHFIWGLILDFFEPAIQCLETALTDFFPKTEIFGQNKKDLKIAYLVTSKTSKAMMAER